MAGWTTRNNNSSTTVSKRWRNDGPSAFQLQLTMLKSDKIWYAYLVANCIMLRTFSTPLVCYLLTLTQRSQQNDVKIEDICIVEAHTCSHRWKDDNILSLVVSYVLSLQSLHVTAAAAARWSWFPVDSVSYTYSRWFLWTTTKIETKILE